MFWGVTLETGKRYSQRVEESYHLTNAALEPPTDQKKPSKYVSVMVEHDKSDYMVCTLEPNRNLQVHLDLMFVEGEEVTYYLTGEGTVHLTGYLVGEAFDDYGEEEDEESSDEEIEVNGLPSKAKNNKRKNEALESSPESIEKKAKVDSKVPNKESKVNENDLKASNKKTKKEVVLEPKKIKNENQVSKNIINNEESAEDDSEDEEESDESDANDSLGLIDNEAVEANDSDDDEEEEEESDDSEVESEPKISPIKGKVNQNQQKPPQNNQKQQNQKNQQNKNQFNSQKSPENQQNKQKQFGSGQKGGFGGQQRGGFGGQQKGGFGGQQKGGFGGQQRGFQQQGGQQKWNQSSGQKNQNPRGGNQWQNRGNPNNSPNFGNKGGNQNNSPNFGGKGGKQTPNFKGQQKANFNQTPNLSGQKEKTQTKQIKLNGGIIVEDLVEGNGPNANVGKFVHVNYVGRLPDNKVFDKTHNKPFSFRLGRGEVIKGWDIGLQDMKVGGKRMIIIPPNMGYGNRSVGPIPANSTLQFEVELKSVS